LLVGWYIFLTESILDSEEQKQQRHEQVENLKKNWGPVNATAAAASAEVWDVCVCE